MNAKRSQMASSHQWTPHCSLSNFKVQSQPSFVIHLLGEFSNNLYRNDVQEKIGLNIFVRHKICILF